MCAPFARIFGSNSIFWAHFAHKFEVHNNNNHRNIINVSHVSDYCFVFTLLPI